MARSRKRYFEIDNVIRMAELYGVADNPMFLQSLKNYETIQKAIKSIDKVLDDDEMMVTKEYVRGRGNLYLNPAIKELPKQIDAANKTIATMMNIIKEYGAVRESDELLDFIQSERA